LNSTWTKRLLKLTPIKKSGAISWILTTALLLLCNQAPFKPLVLAFLISPRRQSSELRGLLLLFSRNLVALAGILWSIHSVLGYFKVESLQNTFLSVLIQVAAIQIIKNWDPREDKNKNNKNIRIRNQCIFYFTLLSIFLFSFLSLPRRLSTFLLGWDHLNGHLWLTAKIFQKGYVQSNAVDSVGIYPKAEFPLILSFSKTIIDFQGLVQGILFVEILLSLATLCMLHNLTFKENIAGKSAEFVKALATILAAPLLFFFIFYGWTSLLLTVSSLLVLTWQAKNSAKGKDYQALFFVALAATQSWTLIAPIVFILVFLTGFRERTKRTAVFTFLFTLINLPPIIVILQFNGIEQVSDGFKSSSSWFFYLALSTSILVYFHLRSKTTPLEFKILIVCTYVEAIVIWLGTSPGRELPYYAIKVFLLSILFIIPYLAHSMIVMIRSNGLRAILSGLLVVGVFGFGNVPASNYSYLNFILGRDLETNWLAENIVKNLSVKSDKRIVLVSSYVIDMDAVSNLSKTKEQKLFAYNWRYICELRLTGQEKLIVIDPNRTLPSCETK